MRPCTRGSEPDLSGSRRRSSPPAARPPRSWPPQAAGCPAGRAAWLGREAPTTTDPSLRRRRGEGPRPARSPVGAPAGDGRSRSDSRPDLSRSWPRPVSLGRAVAFWQLGPAPSPAGARASARAHVRGSPLLRRCRCPHLLLWLLLRGGGGIRAEHRLLRCSPGKRATSTPSTVALTHNAQLQAAPTVARVWPPCIALGAGWRCQAQPDLQMRPQPGWAAGLLRR